MRIVTDRQTARRQCHANSRSRCVQYDWPKLHGLSANSIASICADLLLATNRQLVEALALCAAQKSTDSSSDLY